MAEFTKPGTVCAALQWGKKEAETHKTKPLRLTAQPDSLALHHEDSTPRPAVGTEDSPHQVYGGEGV